MADQTDSVHVDRLIRLLMMLPAPQQPGHEAFWGKVAAESRVDTDYIRNNIAGPLQQILLAPEKDSTFSRENLAEYTLFFFGEPSDNLIKTIASKIDPGGPTDAAGLLWVQRAREAAFEILEAAFEILVESRTDDHVRQACAAWMRSIELRLP